MSDKLIFFNKEGDYLNADYNSITNRYEADLIFHENSSDTFKTIGIYTFEKKAGFTYDVGGDIELDKFQLFNEHGFTFSGSEYNYEFVELIEPTNYDSKFYSKWIYGEDFDIKFPIGSKITFVTPFIEFGNINTVYTVLSVKRGAILILSNLDNLSFYNNYAEIVENPTSYIGVAISGINCIGIKNYTNSVSSNNISSWSEPGFIDKLHVNKKLNVVGGINQGIYTTKSLRLTDSTYTKYYTDSIDLDSNLTVEVHMKNNLPIVYSGVININSDGKLGFGDNVPSVIKPGYRIKFTSDNNSDSYIVSDIISFEDSLMDSRKYEVGYQVMFNGDIFECVEEFDYVIGDDYETPIESEKWSNIPTYIYLDGTFVDELILDCDVYLYNEVYIFSQEMLSTPEATLGIFEDNFRSEFDNLFITLNYDQNLKQLTFDLNYASNYVDVIIKSGSDIITKTMTIFEKNIEVVEKLTNDNDLNLSQINKRDIVFENIDGFGIKVYINGMLYDQECTYVYTNGLVNNQRTIDKTLRDFSKKYYARLLVLGIELKLKNTKDNTNYYNTLVLETTYPNVPIEYDIQVGDNGFYYIRHSSAVFHNIEQYLSINIDGRLYEQQKVVVNGQTSIEETLIEWMDQHYLTLYSFGIFVNRVNNTLYFNKLNSSVDFYYNINVSKSLLPNENDYIIKNYYSGNVGTIITSNSINLIQGSENSFIEDDKFSTGMVVTINNTIYPYVNQQYNIIYVDSNTINLSYQGPFWGKSEEVCINSPFEISAFSDGFESSLCEFPQPGVGGQFNDEQFSNAFAIVNIANQSINESSVIIPSQYGNLHDIIFVNVNETLYVLADSLLIMNSAGTSVEFAIELSETFDKLEIDSVNNKLLLIADDKIISIDTNTNMITNTFGLNVGISKVVVHSGMVFVFYNNSNIITRIYQNNITNYSFSDDIINMVVKPTTNELYVLMDNKLVIAQMSNLYTNNEVVVDLQPQMLYEPNKDTILVFDNQFVNEVVDGVLLPQPKFVGNITSVYFDDVHNYIVYIDDNILYTIEPYTYSVKYSFSINDTYVIKSSPYDGNYYLFSQNGGDYLVIDIINNEVVLSGSVLPEINNIVFNPISQNMVGVNNTNIIFNIVSIIETSIDTTPSVNVDENALGTLHTLYSKPTNIWLNVSEYVRYPRENYEGETQVEYIWKWEDDNINDIFLFDFTGDQLETNGPYKYIGEKPLSDIRLNRSPNKDISKVSDSKYQQTIFNSITYKLDYNNSGNISYLPSPMETFIGFNSFDEGVVSNKLNLYKRENIKYTFKSSTDGHFMLFDTIQVGNVFLGKITISNYSNRSFIYDLDNNFTGLKAGQLIMLKLTDNTNKYNNYISKNSGVKFRINSVDNKTLLLEYIESELIQEASIVEHNSVNTCLDVTITVLDDILATFTISGQTEIEDIRYKTELANSGKLINSEDIYIFKEYDINEKGVDWTYLNKKRKELLMVKHDIFSYVGSYKAIINAINYFGYNDLELYEYYRNINIVSDEYGRLAKVEIPDIFDNNIKGWTDNDFIKQTFPNENYEITNLFNLTYRITDKQGNNIQMYSIDEVLIKLQGLKKWLQKNVVPITHELFDITGRSDSPHTMSVIHKNMSSINYDIKQDMAPINVSIPEAYLMPVNSGSTVYNLKVDFTCQDSVTDDLFYDVKIRTYKTYNEWEPFAVYKKGDKVSYYQQIYVSNIDNNRINDPRKYSDVNSFNVASNYEPFQRTYHKGKIYQWLGTLASLVDYIDNGVEIYVSESSVPIPDFDIRWKDVTEWIPIDYEPVQIIQEYKDKLVPTTITVDTNIDPFIVIEVQSDNGYGMVWTTKKNYELRSTKDLSNAVTVIDSEPLPLRLPDPDPDLPLNEIPVVSCTIDSSTGFAIEDVEACILSMPGGVIGFAKETVYDCQLLSSSGFAKETVYDCSLVIGDGFAEETIGECAISHPAVASAISATTSIINIRYPQKVYGFKSYEAGNGMCRITPSPNGGYTFNPYPTMIIYTDKPSLLESTKIYYDKNSPLSNMNQIIASMQNTVGYYSFTSNYVNITNIPFIDYVWNEHQHNPGNNGNTQHDVGLAGPGGGSINTDHWNKVWITCHDTKISVAIDSNGNIFSRSRCGNII